MPLDELLKAEHFKAWTSEVFGPFQVVTEYGEGELDLVLQACERMDHHLTAAIVSNDKAFQHKVSVNGWIITSPPPSCPTTRPSSTRCEARGITHTLGHTAAPHHM